LRLLPDKAKCRYPKMDYMSSFDTIILVSLFIDPPPWKLDKPYYIPMIFFAVMFYPPVLTPMFALITIWRSILKS